MPVAPIIQKGTERFYFFGPQNRAQFPLSFFVYEIVVIFETHNKIIASNQFPHFQLISKFWGGEKLELVILICYILCKDTDDFKEKSRLFLKKCKKTCPIKNFDHYCPKSRLVII